MLRKLIELFWLVIDWTFSHKEWVKQRRRLNYEYLKSEISKRHFAGYAGLVVDPKKKLDKIDLASFKSPMYGIVKNKDDHWCIFWDRQKLAQEIGVGAPLKEGEVLIEDKLGRTCPDSTLETIDEQRPLTQAIANDS